MDNNNGTYIVTGGAGFIGSCLVRMLNDKGIDDIVIVDHIASTEKWKNLRNKKYREYVEKEEFLSKLMKDHWGKVCTVLHLGACSSTTETDFDYLWRNNVNYSKELWKYCAEKKIQFIYASSAATYGDGSLGFDDYIDIDELRPLNGYGYSKQAFDQWSLRQQECPPQHVGLKFFNVYGPNEYCKGNMASMVYHGFRQIMDTGKIRLFKSGRLDYEDGLQLRDFVYVKDICKMVDYFIEHPNLSGIYNAGTGNAQSFRELALSIFSALDKKPEIEYIDMPRDLMGKYQYYTQAKMDKARAAGVDMKFMDLEHGVADYVVNYLAKDFAIY